MQLLNQMDEWIVLTNHQYEPWFINTAAQKFLAIGHISEWNKSQLLTNALSQAQPEDQAYFTAQDENQKPYFVYKEKTPPFGYKFVIAQMQE